MNYYSNIYWHFTGSPKNLDWTKVYCPNDILKYGIPKDEDECIQILKEIIISKVLKAKCQEKVDDHIISESFCCVTDIPIQNLEEHTKYYGKVAIGFKHEKIQQLFNPVLYVPKSTLVKRQKSQHEIRDSMNSVSLLFGSATKTKIDSNFAVFFGGQRVDESKLGSYIINHFKITNFSNDSRFTFYREREWRKISDFEFDLDDIAVIIAPEDQLINAENILRLHSNKNVPILSWELLKKM